MRGVNRVRLEQNLRDVRKEIREAAVRADRPPGSVELLVVTKYVGPEVLRDLFELGVRDFGESRVQDAQAKAEALEDLTDVHFHLIGHLQRNKARVAIQLFRSIHSLDSLRLARELESRLSKSGTPAPSLYVELNISNEKQKTGLAPDELERFLEDAATCHHLAPAIRGLMGMPPYSSDPEASRPYFQRLRDLRDRMCGRGLLPEDAGLSMGMSSDFLVAVEEGATVVRVGSRIYDAS